MDARLQLNGSHRGSSCALRGAAGVPLRGINVAGPATLRPLRPLNPSLPSLASAGSNLVQGGNSCVQNSRSGTCGGHVSSSRPQENAWRSSSGLRAPASWGASSSRPLSGRLPPYEKRHQLPGTVRAASSDSRAVPDGPFSSAVQRVRSLFWSPYDEEIWAVALPALASMMLDPVLGAINSALIGQMGVAHLSAVSIGSLSVSLCTFVFSFLLFITVPEIAQAVQRKDTDKVSEVAARGIWIAACLGISMSVLVFFGADAIISVMRPADADVAIYAKEFIKIRSFAIVASLVSFVASGTYRGFKDTKTPLKVAMVSTSCSLVLNVLFIHVFKWGVFGAGLATTLASFVSCGLLVYWLINKGTLRVKDLCKPPALTAVLPVLRAGSVLALRNIISFGMIVYASLLCVRAGSMYQASFEVLRQIWILTAQAFECLNVATQALCASYLGMGDVINARAIMHRLATLGIMVAIAASVLVFSIKLPLVSFFTSDPALIQEVFHTLPILCFCFPVDALASIMDGSLMACQQTDYLSFVQICGAGVQYLMLIYLAQNGLISTVAIWSCLKLLSFVRAGGGLYRNIFSRKSAYLLPASA